MKHRIPDLMHAHGAWVFLTVSVGTGAFWAQDAMLLPALLAGTAHAGAFLLVAGMLRGSGGRSAAARGGALALGGALAALALGAEPTFLVVEAFALLPALAAVAAARWLGALSVTAIAMGSLAIALAAPVAACAGGASPMRAALLALLLAPFFAWRTAAVLARLRSTSGGRRASLRDWGLREAGFAAVWSLTLAVIGS